MAVRANRDLREVVRDEMVMRDKITALLAEAPKTIPEIAEAVGAPAGEVLLRVMTMWRYDVVTETGRADADGYFQYRLKEQP